MALYLDTTEVGELYNLYQPVTDESSLTTYRQARLSTELSNERAGYVSFDAEDSSLYQNVEPATKEENSTSELEQPSFTDNRVSELYFPTKSLSFDFPQTAPLAKPIDRGLQHNDWQGRYQELSKLIREITEKTPCQSLISFLSALSELATDFTTTAKQYGKIIVSELFLPTHMKTITPVTVGGVAGGEKYIVHNILFKFALDHNGIFGSDEAAGKVAGHDLKGLIAFYGKSSSEVRFPLMTLINYRGYRLVAMSMLPIDNTTLKYGSSNGGLVVHMDNEALKQHIEQISKQLNLKGHMAGWPESKGGCPAFVHSAVDIEGHVGKDGGYYVVDFARVMPPEYPNFSHYGKNSHLYRLLRPELVADNPVPLCADAFSGFIAGFPDTFDEHNREVKEATEALFNVAVPRAAKELSCSVGKKYQQYTSVKELLHRYGVNLRHSGRVRQLVKEPIPNFCLLQEMVERCLQCDYNKRMREEMRTQANLVETPFLKLTTDFLNLIFGNTTESTKYWNRELKSLLMYKYAESLTVAEQKDEFDLKRMFLNPSDEIKAWKASPLDSVYSTLSSTLGIVCSRSRRFEDMWKSARPFDISDFELDAVVKNTNIIALSRAFLFKQKTHIAIEEDDEYSKHFFGMKAIDHIQHGLASTPTDKDLLATQLFVALMLEKYDLVVATVIRALHLDSDFILSKILRVFEYYKSANQQTTDYKFFRHQYESWFKSYVILRPELVNLGVKVPKVLDDFLATYNIEQGLTGSVNF